MEDFSAILFIIGIIFLFIAALYEEIKLAFVGAAIIFSCLIVLFTTPKKLKKEYKSICEYHISVNLKGYSILTEDGDTLRTIKFGEIPKLDTIIYNDNK